MLSVTRTSQARVVQMSWKSFNLTLSFATKPTLSATQPPLAPNASSGTFGARQLSREQLARMTSAEIAAFFGWFGMAAANDNLETLSESASPYSLEHSLLEVSATTRTLRPSLSATAARCPEIGTPSKSGAWRLTRVICQPQPDSSGGLEESVEIWEEVDLSFPEGDEPELPVIDLTLDEILPPTKYGIFFDVGL